MTLLSRRRLAPAATLMAGAMLGALALLSGCNNNPEPPPAPPPAAAANGGGAPVQTPAEKQAEDAARAQSAASRAAHAPTAPK